MTASVIKIFDSVSDYKRTAVSSFWAATDKNKISHKSVDTRKELMKFNTSSFVVKNFHLFQNLPMNAPGRKLRF